jgi:hypothetical protein
MACWAVWCCMRRTCCIAALMAILSLPASAAATTGAPGWLKLARTELPQLRVKALAPMTGYSRARFGPAWSDVDDNGCDTRDDVLKRDLTAIAFKAGGSCVVQAGTLQDPYTGKAIHFVRGVGTSAAVQIDHVVALGDAWQTGAATWTSARRLTYANDPSVLLAVDGPANEAKGDADAARWLPPRTSFDCRYVSRQIAIKTTYDLWLTQREHDTMVTLLASC